MIVDHLVTEALARIDVGLPLTKAGLFLKTEFGVQKQIISPAHNADKFLFQVTARTDLLTGITSRSALSPVNDSEMLNHDAFWSDGVKGRWVIIEVKKEDEIAGDIPQVVFTALALREKYE
jgi:hypothetical protein